MTREGGRVEKWRNVPRGRMGELRGVPRLRKKGGRVPQVSPLLRDLGPTRPAEAQRKLVRLSMTPGAAFVSISTESRGGGAHQPHRHSGDEGSGRVRRDDPSCAAHLQLPGLAKAARPGAPGVSTE